MTEAEFWEAAEAVLTSRQLTTLRLHIAGMGARRIARDQGISPQAVKDCIFRAKQKVDLELRRRAA